MLVIISDLGLVRELGKSRHSWIVRQEPEEAAISLSNAAVWSNQWTHLSYWIFVERCPLMIGLDVLRICTRLLLGWYFRMSNQTDALCLMILNSSDSWRAENYFHFSLMEPSVDQRIQLDWLCRLSLAMNSVQIQQKRLLWGSTCLWTEFWLF
jgi:hypothetical protein